MNKSCVMKYNGGAGAILCSECNVIMKTGKDFTQEEWKAFRGEIKLASQFCNLCKAKLRDEKIDQILK
jgi:hypothetical protein